MADAISAALLLVETAIICTDQLHSRTSSVRKDLERARNCLARLQQWDNHTNPQAREKQVQDLACNIEDAINEYLLQVSQHSHTNRFSKLAHNVGHFIPDWIASSKLSSSIDELERDLNLVTLLDSVHSNGPQEGRPSSSTGPQGATLTHRFLEDHEIVGYDEEKTRLFQHLGERNPELLTIVIVGPGGSGKTTLVKNVYQSERVSSLFHFQAWIDVPLDLDQLLPKLLRRFKQEVDPHEDISDLQEKLRRILENKKFLVVLDNVWSHEAFESIVNALPKTEGSKLIVITRNIDVAPVSSNYIHDLCAGLSSKKANQLFCKKAFPDVVRNICPTHLEDWAEQIVTRCEGMPWAISQIGTLLARTPRVAVEWKKMHDTLGSDLSIASSISHYRDLPSNHKECFLYFGMFPEDETISRERLIRLWIAEGFVRPDGVKTVEAVAQTILTNLIDRNLVVVSAREIDGRVKNCRVSNLVREFIISKAKHFITVFGSQECWEYCSGFR
ncbi:putative P-loop containing nucleoside triphosphate hydrolase [Rosa chinensis]|uniref:Putative P-loop containing nucleoside triphosphate hydrolase n=1 Tax=Rosa chinensis TaxID=74649 RepID=A0A2P6S4G3_ROSCH|nr:putative P-loop containing nucleoside triphosphate hydrolase [Rosa chinensis]